MGLGFAVHVRRTGSGRAYCMLSAVHWLCGFTDPHPKMSHAVLLCALHALAYWEFRMSRGSQMRSATRGQAWPSAGHLLHIPHPAASIVLSAGPTEATLDQQHAASGASAARDTAAWLQVHILASFARVSLHLHVCLSLSLSLCKAQFLCVRTHNVRTHKGPTLFEHAAIVF